MSMGNGHGHGHGHGKGCGHRHVPGFKATPISKSRNNIIHTCICTYIYRYVYTTLQMCDHEYTEGGDTDDDDVEENADCNYWGEGT